LSEFGPLTSMLKVSEKLILTAPFSKSIKANPIMIRMKINV